MDNFATLEDIELLWRTLTEEEMRRAEVLLPVVSDSLREEAKKVNKNIDEKMLNNLSYSNVVKSVTVDVIARVLMTSTNQEPMSQSSESALGYSFSGTYLIPGGGLFIKKSELARLGLRRQRGGVMNIYGEY